MASELTAAELAELKEKVKADKHGWSSIRAEWLSALIAAAERADAAEKMVRELEEALERIADGTVAHADDCSDSVLLSATQKFARTALGKEPRT